MPVKILDHHSESSQAVEHSDIVATVEKNRDRVRTTAGMLLTLAGILISFSTGVLLYVSKDTPQDHRTVSIFSYSVGAFILVAMFAIFSTFLRTSYPISNRVQFLDDLLALYRKELQFLHVAAIIAIVGLLIIAAGAISFVVSLK